MIGYRSSPQALVNFNLLSVPDKNFMTLKQGIFRRLFQSRESLSGGLANIFSARNTFDDSTFDDIEEQLIISDFGVAAAASLVTQLKSNSRKQNLSDSSALLALLKSLMQAKLNASLEGMDYSQLQKPVVILMVGVNGVGKTTTMAKLANRKKQGGAKVMLAACDTFRAAAIEQLQSWGQRLDIPVIAQSHGADAAAVAYDAYRAACAREMDFLLIDTAGRQHTHGDLMDQLEKIQRVLAKANDQIPHEVYLTLDAGNGQNVLSQVENFNAKIPLTGLCVTKLDGTAKAGVVIGLADRFNIPIRYMGVGEGVDDLRPFAADEFIDALMPDITDDAE